MPSAAWPSTASKSGCQSERYVWRTVRAGMPAAVGYETKHAPCMKYCPECASKLGAKRVGGVERMACVAPACGYIHWDNPVPVVAALVQYQDKIILARNSQWPEGMFSLVTGFLERNETSTQAVMREVNEELGLVATALGLIGCYSLFEKNQIILAYWAMTTGELRTGSEISEVKSVSRQELEFWQFGELTLTSVIVKNWLEKTGTSDNAFSKAWMRMALI